MKVGAIVAFLANALGVSIVEPVRTDELCYLPTSPWVGLTKPDQLLQLGIWGGGASVWTLLQVGLIRSVCLIRRTLISPSEHQQDLIHHFERLTVAAKVEARAAHARLAVDVLQLPNLLVHDHTILRLL
eukprot:4817780-Prymnesium_polylepis.1